MNACPKSRRSSLFRHSEVDNVGSLRKAAAKSVHEDRSKEDGERLSKFLMTSPDDGRQLVVGVKNKEIGEKTMRHIHPDLRRRVRFQVVDAVPEGLPGFAQSGGRPHDPTPLGRLK